MKKDDTRYITLKISVNEQEQLQIRRSCTALGKTVSATGRELLLKLSAPAHRRPRHPNREWPKFGPVAQPRFPGRRGCAPVPLRL
jgi:hypothetical protein